MVRIQFVLIALALLLPISAIAQQDSSWQLRLSNGDTLAECTLVSLRKTSLAIVHQGRTLAIPVESIEGLVRERKSRLWSGMVLGTLAGVVVGVFVASEMTDSERLFSGLRGAAAAGYCTLGGFAIGGVIGAAAGTDEVFDLSEKNVPKKINVIQSILLDAKE